MELMKTFWSDESGQGLTEYAVIIGLVSVALLLVLLAFRNEIARVFNEARTQLNQNASPSQAAT